MSEIFTGYSIPKSLTKNENQIISDLKKMSVQQSLAEANSKINSGESIFSLKQTDFSSTETVFFEKLFEKTLTEKAYQSMQKDLSLLRFQEKALTTTQSLSEKKIVDHENNLKSNPEVMGIENEIRSNQQEIQKKQQVLGNRTKTQSRNENILSRNSLLKNDVVQLRNVEFSLVSDIDSIKDQIQQIKSGKFSISDLQKSVTGSISTSAVDISKNSGSSSSLTAALGSQQISEDKGFQDLLKSVTSEQSHKAQKEIENQIKNTIIQALEGLLGQKEDQLSSTKNQIKNKETQLDDNQTKFNSSEDENATGVDENETLQLELEELIKQTSDLVDLRIKKDPELVKYTSVANFFNNILIGNEQTGVGINPEKARKKDSFAEIKDEYENKASQTDTYQEMYEIRSFLRNEAKSNLDNSRNQTLEQENIFLSLQETFEKPQ
ncbi:MAG TPA: hypothetical protein P5556_06685 [Candidatus Gastranaerophilales bacterium]|nr:hypothetical protein [Candidatus Gastranaerophilales bacterium]